MLPTIGSGGFGLLPPMGSQGTTGRVGKIYSFRVLE
jgi:hypothetical protein